MAQRRRLQREARRDVRLAIHPELAQLERLRAQTIADYGRSIDRSNSIYGQEQSALSGLPGQFGHESGDILGNLQRALGAFGGTKGGYANENAASGKAMNAGARGALGVLGAAQSSDLANVTAALTAAGMQRKEQAQGFLGQQQDALQQIGMQRADVVSQMPALVLQRLDQLRQQAIANEQARQQMELAQRQFGLDRRTALAGIASTNQQNDLALQEWEAQQASDRALQQYLAGVLGGYLGPGAAAPGAPRSPYLLPPPVAPAPPPYGYKPLP